MAPLPSPLISHRAKVCSLYKRSLRALEDWYIHLPECRFQVALMRQRFKENMYIKDMRKSKELLLQGEEELYQKVHPVPKKFATSIGGSAYGRQAYIADWILDYWDPKEKELYPKFFARREELKKELLEKYYNTHQEIKPKKKE